MPVCLKCQSPVNKNGQCNLCLLQVGLDTSNRNQQIQHPDSKDLPTIDEISASFPQLTIQRLIGRGGMGAIYLARQTALDRQVAVKLISKEISNDVIFIERFEREARALAKLNHPHVVTVFDSGRTPDGTAYLIMEFVEGINLREAIQSMPISADDAVEYISKMAMALQYAHEKGIVHRDIKPENVLLGEDGSLKIVDFGIAKILAGADGPVDNLTRTRQVLGTPHYLAPEHLDAHGQVDHRVDLYSLGVLFYELLTRKLPMGNFEQPSAINPNVSSSIDRIVSKCMQRNPNLRYQTASELHEDLKALAVPNREPILVASHSNRGVSVPFVCEALGGFASARGMIRAMEHGLRIEYKLTDELLGTFKSQLQVLEIPRENLVRIDLKNGWFNVHLSLVVDSIEQIDTFPNSESGRIGVIIRRDDRSLAEQLIETMNLAPAIDRVANNVVFNSPTPPLNPIIGTLLIAFGILNTFLIIATAIVFSNIEPTTMGLAIAMTFWIGLGLLATTQILSVIMCLTAGKRSLIKPALISTTLPISPLFLLGIPFAIWAGTRLSKKTASHSNVIPSQKPSGATTLMWLRERRVANMFSVLETLGACLVLGCMSVYYFGLFPTRIDYRMVTSDTELMQYEVRNAINSRLARIDNVNVEFSWEPILCVQAWAFQRKEIMSRLQMASAPKLHILVPSEWSAPDSVVSYMLPIAKDLQEAENAVEKAPVGKVVRCIAVPDGLASDRVRGMTTQHLNASRSLTTRPHLLVIEWSQQGRKELETILNKGKTDTKIKFGIEVDGILVAVSESQWVDGSSTSFELSPASRLDVDSMIAAVRGPDIPCELECLSR